ncbi:MAG TPA: PQQ-binding-like beta-propeller repeat protein [Vicinamibacterales bacterium]|nr:PQQ-binding-like beta-propeller repeat protein [Vicinamibacterales bacterium]
MRLFLTGVLVAFSLIVTSIVTSARGPSEWPQFRGPHGSGIADGSSLPERWSDSQNVAWSFDVPGRGWSSPIVWRDRVFVTSAISPGAFKAPSTGIFGNDYVAELMKQGLAVEEVNKRVIDRDIERTGETGEIRYMVYALDAKSGKVVWEREAHRGQPFGGRHRKNTYASETPVTDGERVYVSFGGNVGIFCYSMDGTLLWKHSWPPQPIYLDFGTASSPVVHDGRVYQLHDNDGESFFAALDARTGKELWKVRRTDNAPMKSGWATPFIWESGSRTEIVTIGRGLVISHDASGKELWRLKGMTQATPSPVAADGLLYVGSGSQGEANRPLMAVRPGASGDVSLTADQDNNEFVVWRQPRFSGYTPSPLVYRGRVYAINDNGILQVGDARTGKEIYKARVGGGGHTFSSSPLASQGRLYLLSEDGDTFVLRAGDKYDEIAKNSLGEMSLATPAVDADSLYVRTQTKLYRIRDR